MNRPSYGSASGRGGTFHASSRGGAGGGRGGHEADDGDDDEPTLTQTIGAEAAEQLQTALVSDAHHALLAGLEDEAAGAAANEPDAAAAAVTLTCSVCGALPRYRCPKCRARTCSLACVHTHKASTPCTGVADVAGFVPLAKFDDGQLRRDFHFVEDCRRVADNARRNLSHMWRINFRALPPPLHALREAAKRHGVICQITSEGLSKREANSSRYDRKRDTITWRADFRFHRLPSEGGPFVIGSDWGSERFLLGDLCRSCWQLNPALKSYHIRRMYNRASSWVTGSVSAVARPPGSKGTSVLGSDHQQPPAVPASDVGALSADDAEEALHHGEDDDDALSGAGGGLTATAPSVEWDDNEPPPPFHESTMAHWSDMCDAAAKRFAGTSARPPTSLAADGNRAVHDDDDGAASQCASTVASGISATPSTGTMSAARALVTVAPRNAVATDVASKVRAEAFFSRHDNVFNIHYVAAPDPTLRDWTEGSGVTSKPDEGLVILSRAERLGVTVAYHVMDPRVPVHDALRQLFFVNEYPIFDVVPARYLARQRPMPVGGGATAEAQQVPTPLDEGADPTSLSCMHFPLITDAQRSAIRESFRKRPREGFEGSAGGGGGPSAFRRDGPLPPPRTFDDLDPEQRAKMGRIPCRSFTQRSTCIRGDTCPYMHCKSSEVPLCRTFAKSGQCEHTGRCSFRHVMLDSDAAVPSYPHRPTQSERGGRGGYRGGGPPSRDRGGYSAHAH